MNADISATAPRMNRLAVTALSLSMLLASFGTSVANIALPVIADSLSISFGEVQWVVIAYLGALTASTFFAGLLGDLLGFRRMHLAGLAIFAAASLACGLSQSLPLLIAARLLQGAAAGVMMTLSMALMREVADERHLGRAMGLLGTVSAVGTALGPALGGVLMPLAGWQGLFFLCVPLAIIALLTALPSLPRQGAGVKATPTGPGFSVRAMIPNLAINVLVASVMMTTLIVGPFHLALGLRLSPSTTGLVMAVGPAISIMIGLPAGQLVDRYGPALTLRIGLTLIAAGCAIIALSAQDHGVGGYMLAIAILTPGYQLFQAANNTSVLADMPAAWRGRTSGLLSLSRNLGLILGASAMARLFATGAGAADIARATPEAIAAGTALAFAIAAGLMLAALAATLSGAMNRKP